MKFSKAFGVILPILLCLACNSSSSQKEEMDHPEEIMNAYYQAGVFNGCAFVMKGDQVLLNKGYGYADEQKEFLLKPDSKFGIGSIYKEFPAVSIMKLVEDGFLNVNDPISKYLTQLPKWAESIRIEHLLQYTSGLPRIDFGKYFGSGEHISDSDIWNDILNIEELEFDSGSDYIYTNMSPFLLIKIVEKISGMGFKEYVSDTFFVPLGMDGTVIKDQYPYVDQQSMANPFSADGERDQYTIESSNLLFTSSTKDIARWAKALNNFELISEASVLYLSKTAYLANDDMQAPLGNCTISNGSIVEHYHHGSMGNYEALVKRYNDSDITVVLLTNQKNSNVFEILDKVYLSVSK